MDPSLWLVTGQLPYPIPSHQRLGATAPYPASALSKSPPTRSSNIRGSLCGRPVFRWAGRIIYLVNQSLHWRWRVFWVSRKIKIILSHGTSIPLR